MSLTLTAPSSSPPIIFHHHHHTSNPIFLTSHSKTHQKFLCFTSRNPRKNIKKISDVELASEFAAEMHKINTQIEEKQNALIKTKQMLFSDFSKFLTLNPDEVNVNWMKMNPDEKLSLVKVFVSDWGLNFHPLSPKSVRDLIDEFVMNDLVVKREKSDSSSSFDSLVNFSRLKSVIMGGLSQDC